MPGHSGGGDKSTSVERGVEPRKDGKRKKSSRGRSKSSNKTTKAPTLQATRAEYVGSEEGLQMGHSVCEPNHKCTRDSGDPVVSTDDDLIDVAISKEPNTRIRLRPWPVRILLVPIAVVAAVLVLPIAILVSSSST